MFVRQLKISWGQRSRLTALSALMLVVMGLIPAISAQEIRPAEIEVRDVIMILAMTPEGANLEGLSFVNYDFSYLNFKDANLNRSILNGAKLHDTIFINTSLIYTDLSGAILDGAVFTGADLSNASLSGASLTQTDFRGANLSGANLSDTYVSKTLFDETTIMPDGRPWSPTMDIALYTDRENPNYIIPVGVDTPYIEEIELNDAVSNIAP